MANATSPVLVQRPPLANIVTPFDGDLLERAAVARRLTTYLQRLQIGAVIAIDAPWGEGKTWFGRHWAKNLENDGHRVAFVDAFGQDYAEDAFMVLSAAILRLCADDAKTTEKVKRGAGEVMRALLPAATKAAIHLAATAMGAGAVVGAFKELTAIEIEADEFASAAKQAGDKAGDVTSAWVERRLGQWEAEQKSVDGFRRILAEFAQERFEETGKPVVIVVDELDRCRPAFAVALLERIKHFFDVPHLVFVLLMNRDQLEAAIRGVYGAETDAAAYLGKFLHLSLRLPKSQSLDISLDHPTAIYVGWVLEGLGIQRAAFEKHFTACAFFFDLTLREIERGCTLYALTDGKQELLLAYTIALKIKWSRIHQSFLDPSRAEQAHKECRDILEAKARLLLTKAPAGSRPASEINIHDLGFPGPYLDGLLQLHGKFVGRTDRRYLYPDTEERSDRNMARVCGDDDLAEAFERSVRAIDLVVR